MKNRRDPSWTDRLARVYWAIVGLVGLGRPIVDTAALTRACGLADANSGREPDVETVARGLGLPVHTPHHALGDAFTTAEIFLVLATRLEREPNVVGRSQLSVRRLCALSRRHSKV